MTKIKSWRYGSACFPPPHLVCIVCVPESSAAGVDGRKVEVGGGGGGVVTSRMGRLDAMLESRVQPSQESLCFRNNRLITKRWYKMYASVPRVHPIPNILTPEKTWIVIAHTDAIFFESPWKVSSLKVNRMR